MSSRPFTNILDLIERQAERFPDSIAIEDTGSLKLTYRDLAAKVRDFSHALTGHGVIRTSRVAIMLPNGPEMAIALLGVSTTAVAVPLNPAYRAEEIRSYFETIRIGYLIFLQGSTSVARAVAAEMEIKVLELPGNGGFALSGPPGDINSAAVPTAETRRPEPDDIAAILMTSGSTGRPKKVPLTHRNLCVSVGDSCRSMALGPEDRCLCIWQQFHISGLNGLLMAPLAAGGTVICTPGFDPAEFFRLLKTKKPTWFMGVPTALHALVLHDGKGPAIAKPASLRFICSGAAALPPELLAEIEALFDVPVLSTYGMTEAAPSLTSMRLPPAERKPGSVGPSCGPEIRILGPDGEALEPGQTGEVVARGNNFVAGYEDDPQATAHAFRDGWYHTGDSGYLDTDGHLFLKGRLDQMINRGGEKVNPPEIDDALMTHPAIAQVAAFAVAHRTLGQDVVAAVVLKPAKTVTEAELRAFLAERMTSFKVPSKVIFLDQLPRNAVGKIDRLALAEMAKAETPNSATPSPISDLETQLQEIWATALGLEQVGLHDNYFELGGDSLQAVELFLQVEQALGRRLPTSALIEAGTVAKMAWHIENASASGCLVPLQPKGELAAFFCVHGLGGDILCLRDLARHMGHSRPFYGISNRDLDRREWRFADLDAMAARYVSEIREQQPAGPYYLGGYSLGGQVAYVMAQQLLAANQEVALLALIDAYSGVEGGLSRKPLPQRLGRHRSALAALQLKDWPAYVLRRLRNIAANARKSLSHRTHLAARPKPFCNTVLFKIERLTERYPDTLDSWHKLTQGRVQVVPVPGDHTTLLKEPHVRILAAKLTEYLKD